VHIADHLGPAFGGRTPELLLDHLERRRPKACLPDLALRGIGVEAIIAAENIYWLTISVVES
jgi:hypothetical protein